MPDIRPDDPPFDSPLGKWTAADGERDYGYLKNYVVVHREKAKPRVQYVNIPTMLFAALKEALPSVLYAQMRKHGAHFQLVEMTHTDKEKMYLFEVVALPPAKARYTLWYFSQKHVPGWLLTGVL